jgi:hypothetical protein
MRDSVGRYLDEIGAIRLLGADQERQLSQGSRPGAKPRVDSMPASAAATCTPP